MINLLWEKKELSIMNKKIAVLAENGFEEIEMIIPIDILRRLQFKLLIAGANKEVEGSHGLKIKSDLLISELKPEELSCVILPGGMPGSVNLMKNQNVIEIVRKIHAQNGIVAAICAAPIALAAAGITKDKKITAHPSVEEQLESARYSGSLVERDENIITGKGPGAAFEFALFIAESLGKGEDAKKLLKDMFITD